MVRQKIIDYCKGKEPIPFILEGEGEFDGGIKYIPVKGSEIKNFDVRLEKLLAADVSFVEKLDEKKTLHLTIEADHLNPFPRTNLYMIRLTCLKDKRIWFSFDFETQEILNREQSLS